MMFCDISRNFLTQSLFKIRPRFRLGILAFVCAIVAGQSLKSGKAYAQIAPITEAEKGKLSAPIVSGVTLSFTPLTGQGSPVVHFRINDKMDARFIIDTGSDSSYINPDLVKQLALPIKTKKAANDSQSVKTESQISYVSIDKIKAGELTLNGDLIVLDTAPDLPNKPYDGILGANFLSSLAVLFDFTENKILLVDGGKLSDAQLRFLGIPGGTSSYVPASSVSSSGYVVSVPVLLEGVTGGSMIIDTGAARTMILDPDKKINLPADIRGVPYTFQTVDRSWKYTVYPFSPFGVGKTFASATPNILTDFECGIIAPDAKEADSILGLDYLSRFRVLLDYPAKRFYLTPAYNPEKNRFPTEASRQSAETGLEDMGLIPAKGDEWTVTETEKDGVFGKYGIRAGDVIKKINGQSIDGKGISEVVTLLLKKSRAELELRRDGKPVKITLHRK